MLLKKITEIVLKTKNSVRKDKIWLNVDMRQERWLLWQLQMTCGETVDTLKFLQGMNEQLLKVSASQSKSPFQNYEKNL